MNFINPELNLKNDTRKIKRDIHNSKKGIHKCYFPTTFSIFEVDNPWKRV